MDRIERTIHYCWFGGGEHPALVRSCIESWRTHLNDYRIVCWNEERFDTSSHPFVRQAYAAGKWAFVADYVRFYALYQHGGIYLDTDVMVWKSFDRFLSHRAFSGLEFHPEMFFESVKRGSVAGLGILSAVVGAEKGHPWIHRLLSQYDGRQFNDDPRSCERLIVSGLMAHISACEFGFEYVPLYQVLRTDVHLYPPDVFYSKPSTDNPVLYASHHCLSSWREPEAPGPLLSRVARRIRPRWNPRRSPS
jgi:Glycosyltransferase sugar-binding region containing DXD motif